MIKIKMEVNMTKLVFTVEKGRTTCDNCPIGSSGEFACCHRRNGISLDCEKYDLSTLSLIKEEE